MQFYKWNNSLKYICMHAQTIVINNRIDRCKSCLAPCRVSKKRIYKRDQAGEKIEISECQGQLRTVSLQKVDYSDRTFAIAKVCFNSKWMVQSYVTDLLQKKIMYFYDRQLYKSKYFELKVEPVSNEKFRYNYFWLTDLHVWNESK